MRKFRHLLAGLIAGALFASGVAFSQTGAGYQLLTTLTGNELVSVIGTGAVITQVKTNVLRNTTGYLILSSTTGTQVMTVATNNLLLTGAVTTMTVDLPPSPADGQLFAINNATSSNFSGTITVATTDSSTISNGSSLTNLAANTSAEYQYTATSKVWYRLR